MPPSALDLYDASISELLDGLQAGHFTSVDLVRAYLSRIDEVNTKGPCLRAVISLNPHAEDVAASLDKERSIGQLRGPLHGIPIMVKDNMDTQPEDGMPTTAGSFALVDTKTPGDAPAVARLKEAGAIILGKGNLTEWSCYRGDLPNGWSPVGGQGLNPFATTCKGDPCGSSSGCATATTLGLAAASVGSQTYGSIVYPASWQNVVGLKPTHGVVPAAGVVPIAPRFDCLGPLTRTVQDAALLFKVLAKEDRDQGLPSKTTLQGVRLGVPRNLLQGPRLAMVSQRSDRFEEALADLRALGADIVDVQDMTMVSLQNMNDFAIRGSGEFKTAIEAYLGTLTGPEDRVKTLDDIVQFTQTDPRESPEGYEGVQRWDELLRDWKTQDPAQNAVAQQITDLLIKQARQSIDDVLQRYQVTALLDSTDCMMADLAGYPNLSVPMGFSDPGTETLKQMSPNEKQEKICYDFKGQPLGLMIYAAPRAEKDLLEVAYAFEQRTQHRLSRKAPVANVPTTQL